MFLRKILDSETILSATDSLSGGQFFAVLRLIIHAENGEEVEIFGFRTRYVMSD